MIKLAVFLGNPGQEYEKTRHNAGWILADYLFAGQQWTDKKNHLYLKDSTGTACIKPMVFMNLSGQPAGEVMRYYKWTTDEVLVIHDEIELDCGEAVFVKGGGLKGHNGLRSLEKSMGNANFYRLKIGVGRPSKGDVASWVLGKFSVDHWNKIEDVCQRIQFQWQNILRFEKSMKI